MEPLDVAATLRGKRILFIGATGFVGKVALSMLLRRYPDLGKLYVLVRPGAGSSSEDRFFQKIVASPTFDPIREAWGAGTEAFLREKVEPLPGDVSRPLCNFTEPDLQRLGKLDLIINCAGLVSFNPSLETALRINVLGPKHALDVAKKSGAAIIHISTCFVAGNRDGEVWEDEPLVGYFPRKDRGDGSQTDVLRDDDFSPETEIVDCQRVIDQVKSRADDRAHVSEFRDRGAARLKAEGRDADDERTLKVAVQRERKIWIAEKLTDLGMERAQHWGWPNTYTYTKSLGDQVCAAAEKDGVRACIVRPAIVESSIHYPFPGWNEGFTTSAPLAFLSIKGHRTYPAGERATLDIIPVDMVASGLIMAAAATLAGENELVYQLGSSDLNPLYMRRAVELLGLHKRSYFGKRRDSGEGSSLLNRALARLEPVAVSRERFNSTSAPLWKAAANRLTRLIDEKTPRWGAPRLQAMAEHAKDRLGAVANLAKQTDDLFQLFMPFIHERKYVFRCDHIRALHARLTPADQQRLALGSRGDRLARVLARRAHGRAREVGLPGAGRGVRRQAAQRLHLQGSARDVRRHHQASQEPHRDADFAVGERIGGALQLRAAGRRRRARGGAPARARRGRGGQGHAGVGEPARVGHHLLWHPQGGRDRGAHRLAVVGRGGRRT